MGNLAEAARCRAAVVVYEDAKRQMPDAPPLIHMVFTFLATKYARLAESLEREQAAQATDA